jgi:hypothetical protein
MKIKSIVYLYNPGKGRMYIRRSRGTALVVARRAEKWRAINCTRKT